ncbi:M14 family zinc carboxypeptidase [Nocardia nepalensis]|uniref:M14 family zinc carboxypeptidase n=1 Tax=Nocardia nepalensis TaxID=3375448 RepID=UPI003B67AFCB
MFEVLRRPTWLCLLPKRRNHFRARPCASGLLDVGDGTESVWENCGSDSPAPERESFYGDAGVASQNAFIDRLAADHTGRVVVTEIGRSRGGQAIRNVHIGSGPRSILVLGSPHSNEPIGLATTHHLLGRLAADESLTSSLEATWNFVPLVDPDATLLGEGWFDGPFTRTNVARHFYRPPADLQAEWTFQFL